MTRDQVVALLKQHEPEFRRGGIGALFLFGSTARDEARDASDVDIFFDLDRPQGFTLFIISFSPSKSLLSSED